MNQKDATDPLLSLCTCPACGAGPLVVEGPKVRCSACAAVLGTAALPDLAPHLPAEVPGSAATSGPTRWARAARWKRAVQSLSGLSYAGEAAWLRAWCKPVDGPILELACGGGREARVLASLFGGGRVIACDLNPEMLRRAADTSQGSGIRYFRADATRLPFVDDSLGAVNCFGALHLLDDPRSAVQEVARVLAPGGTFTGHSAIYDVHDPLSSLHAALAGLTGMLDGTFVQGWLKETGLVDVELSYHRGVALFRGRKPGPDDAE